MTEKQKCKEHVWYKQAAIRCVNCGISSTPQKIILAENKRVLDKMSDLADDMRSAAHITHQAWHDMKNVIASLRCEKKEGD